MKFVPDTLYNFWRKHFGSYSLDDPRPIAKESPYTFYLPPKTFIDSLGPGDIAKLIFRGSPAGLNTNAERMWVEITKRDGDRFEGTLDNIPTDMPQLSLGDPVTFSSHEIIDFEWRHPETKTHLKHPPSKQNWDRCLVDDVILDGAAKVEYIYREDPDMDKDGDEYKDSGWRIRGDHRVGTDEEWENRTASYVAIGAVLNQDDSWLHLVNSPIGSAFIKNFDTDKFEATENEDSND